MMIKQHKHKWKILLYAAASFATREPWKLFLREYGNNRDEINWVECHDGEIGMSRYAFKPKKDFLSLLWYENKSLIQMKVKKIITVIKE